MFTKFSRKTLFAKITAIIISVGFILINIPTTYASVDKLRPQAAKSSGAAEDIQGELGGGSNPLRPVTGGSGEADTISSVPALLSFGRSELDGIRVLERVDWNIPNPNSVERIQASLRGLIRIIENGGTPIVLSHYGRPGGKVKPELSTEPLADIARELLKKQGYPDIEVVFHKGSITENGVAEGLKERIVPGAINVLENTRFCPGDEKNDPKFAQALADLAGEKGIFVFDGFGVGERVHASTAGLAEYMERIALGPLVVNEEKAIRDALKTLYGIIFGGGPKVSEKLPMLKEALKNIQEGGFIIIGSGPLPAFLKLEGIEVGQKPTDEDVRSAGEIVELAKKMKVRIILPEAVVVTDKDLSEKAEGDKSWLDLKKNPSPEIYRASLEELRRGGGTVYINGKRHYLSTRYLFVYDVAPKLEGSDAWLYDALRNAIVSVPKGRSIVWNGSLGVNEIKEFSSGTKAIAQALVRATQYGVKTVAVGGDTTEAAKQFGAADKLTYVSTGGGAALALLEGKELAAVEKLTEIQATIDTAQKLNVKLGKLRDFLKADNAIYATLAGKSFADYVKSLQGTLQVSQSPQALIIGPNFFKLGGVKNVLAQVAQLSRGVRIALYGEDAEKLKIILGNKEIIIAKTLDELMPQLTKLGIEPANIVLLRSPDDGGITDVRQIVAGQLSTVAVAKALHILLGNDTAFAKFYEEVRKVGIISEEAYTKTKEALLAKLEKGIFELPAIELTPQVTTQLEKDRLETEEFISQV